MDRSSFGGCPPEEAGFGAASREQGVGTEGNGSARTPGTEAFRRLKSQTGELYEYFLYFLTAKLDGVKLSLRKAAVGAALGLVGLFLAAGLAATLGGVTTYFLLHGAAGGLGTLFGGREWLGELTVGLLFFAAVGAALGIVLPRMGKAARKKLRQKYEQMKIHQRAEYGMNVEEKASALRNP